MVSLVFVGFRWFYDISVIESRKLLHTLDQRLCNINYIGIAFLFLAVGFVGVRWVSLGLLHVNYRKKETAAYPLPDTFNRNQLVLACIFLAVGFSGVRWFLLVSIGVRWLLRHCNYRKQEIAPTQSQSNLV